MPASYLPCTSFHGTTPFLRVSPYVYSLVPWKEVQGRYGGGILMIRVEAPEGFLIRGPPGALPGSAELTECDVLIEMISRAQKTCKCTEFWGPSNILGSLGGQGLGSWGPQSLKYCPDLPTPKLPQHTTLIAKEIKSIVSLYC